MEQNIIAAIERLASAFRFILWDIAKKTQLSPIQIQFLVYLNNHSEELCRASQIAREFGLTKSTVSGAIKALKRKRLICKKAWQDDNRVSTLKLTPLGKRLTKDLAGWANSILTHIKKFSPGVKQDVMIFLMELIASLKNSGIINVDRMCITCANFQKDAHPGTDSPHYCVLTDRRIPNSELRMDCQRHKNRLYPEYRKNRFNLL